jgi:hypothetical protein
VVSHEYYCVCESCLTSDMARADEVEASNGAIHHLGNVIRQGELAATILRLRGELNDLKKEIQPHRAGACDACGDKGYSRLCHACR